jgi:hypothetical protein
MFSITRPFNSWDAIKVLALFLMFVDHAGYFFFNEQDSHWMRAIGRGAAPIFLFLAGYASSYRFKWDLFALAALMTISDTLLVGHLRTQNILVTILLTRMLFYWVESRDTYIKHPYEWLIGAAFWLPTMLLTQYGTFGIIFGICGYVKRRHDLYPPHMHHDMLAIAFILFAATSIFTFRFDMIASIITTLVLTGVCWLLIRLELKPIHMPRTPRPVVWGLQQTAIYSGYIYAFHLIALEWITGKHF